MQHNTQVNGYGPSPVGPAAGISPVVMVEAASKPHLIVSAGKGKALICLGVFQVLIGLASIAVNGVGYLFFNSFTYTAPGIWSGVMFLCSGIVAIVAGANKNVKTVVASMTLATISAVLAVVLLCFAVVSLYFNYVYHSIRRIDRTTGTETFIGWVYGESAYHGANLTDGLLIACAVLELFVALPASGIICNSFCSLQMARPY